MASLVLTVGCSRASDAPPDEGAAPTPAIPAPVIPETLEVSVTGDDYRWHLRYPGADGVLGTSDDLAAMRDVRVPANAHVVLHLHSRDYVYMLRLPHYGLAEIAVPRQEFSLELDSGPPGAHELRGDQFCGFTHPQLIGTLHVDTDADFAAWLAQLAPARDHPGDEDR